MADRALDNGAARTHRAARDALRAGDRAGFAATRTDDFVVTVHVPEEERSFLPTDAEVRDDADCAIGLWPGRDAPADEEVVAVDGDHRCLIRVVDDVAFAVFEHLVVIGSRDGRIASEDWFAADRLEEAMGLLRSPRPTGRRSATSGERPGRPR